MQELSNICILSSLWLVNWNCTSVCIFSFCITRMFETKLYFFIFINALGINYLLLQLIPSVDTSRGKDVSCYPSGTLISSTSFLDIHVTTIFFSGRASTLLQVHAHCLPLGVLQPSAHWPPVLHEAPRKTAQDSSNDQGELHFLHSKRLAELCKCWPLYMVLKKNYSKRLRSQRRIERKDWVWYGERKRLSWIRGQVKDAAVSLIRNSELWLGKALLHKYY